MKGKTGIVVLVILCIALGVGLLVRHAKAVEEQHKAEAKIKQLSEDVMHTQDQLSEQKKVNDTLEKDLETRNTEAQNLSNKLEAVTTTLAKTEQDAKAAAEQAKDEIARRDAKISDLEGKNDDLTKQMADLNTSITSLESQIDDTKKNIADKDWSSADYNAKLVDVELNEVSDADKKPIQHHSQLIHLSLCRHGICRNRSIRR